MGNLEVYAKEKDAEKESMKTAAVEMFRSGDFDERLLVYIIDKTYQLGHNAGHCRGETYSFGLREGKLS